MEELVKKRSVIAKKSTKLFRNSKDTMTVSTGNEFKRHVQRTHLVVFVSTRRTEPALTTKCDKFHSAAMRTAVESPAFGIVSTIDHFGNIFNNGSPRMQFIKDVFIIIRKNRL